ncbi:MAG: GlsB/YeaQ/YmgE family stress response membrane protein [Planctomycetota bacterium]|jgi:uncharacterized membrane protein YeaQ/YmgE (transglycosylase-associated protein family)
MHFLYIAVIGLAAGWIASLLLGGGGGLIRNLVIGVAGALIGGVVVPKLGLTLTSNVHANNVITASIGALLLLAVLQFLTRK